MHLLMIYCIFLLTYKLLTFCELSLGYIDFFLKGAYIISNRSPRTSQRCVPGDTFYLQRKIIMILKQPTTFAQQVQLLQDKNIMIDDLSACQKFLEKVNYYRFSAYFLPFYNPNTQKCFDNITFTRLKHIYSFDQKLRSLIFSMIEDIEIHIKTQTAYYLSHKYGALGYMSQKTYNSRHDHNSFMNRIADCIKENNKTPVVKHHIKKYNGQFPLWVIIEFFSVGMLSHFYRSLKTPDKKKIAIALYNTSYFNLESWLRCLTDLRNKCAHYSRLYYWIFPATPKMPKGEKYTPTRRLFAQLYMLKYMYPDTEKWNDFYLKSLIKFIQEYKPYISLKHLDFPYK